MSSDMPPGIHPAISPKILQELIWKVSSRITLKTTPGIPSETLQRIISNLARIASEISTWNFPDLFNTQIISEGVISYKNVFRKPCQLRNFSNSSKIPWIVKKIFCNCSRDSLGFIRKFSSEVASLNFLQESLQEFLHWFRQKFHK